MAWDIYGEHLRRGHCEVHPWVHDEFPCCICLQERDVKQKQEQEQIEKYNAYQKLYELEQNENINGDGI